MKKSNRFTVTLVVILATLVLAPARPARADPLVRYVRPGGTGDCSDWDRRL